MGDRRGKEDKCPTCRVLPRKDTAEKKKRVPKVKLL